MADMDKAGVRKAILSMASTPGVWFDLPLPKVIEMVRSVNEYGAEMVRDFKFHADIAWARSFARMMRSTPWVDPALEAADWIVPMPLSRQRLLERGFNQSDVLAAALETGQPRKVRRDVLVRTRDTAAQSSLPRSERHANVANAYVVHPEGFNAVQGKKVVLVDDVMTTGASLHAAARALAQAGAAQTIALVFARTP
ncbi:MAG: ComF family protein [Betaproteobacteria bacterium]|nr:ComF family protein [Betaproteobacteria bacterium]